MKKKIVITDFKTFSKVNYYSLKFECEESTEYQRFEEKYIESEYQESYKLLNYWLAFIGEQRGAKKNLFRKEQMTNESRHKFATALPPNAQFMEELLHIFSGVIGSDDNLNLELRLYCLWLSESVVILYNGSVKTAELANKCANCKPYFKNINEISAQFEGQVLTDDIVEKRLKRKSLFKLEIEKV